jgi:hypothetical protein
MRWRTAVSFIAASAIWLPNVHRFCAVDRVRVTETMAHAPEPDATRMRGVNPEWDFMSRTFTVLALANRALDRPDERETLLASMDRIIDRLIREERERGQTHFMMAYATRAPFVDPEGASIFVDGETLMMIVARELVRTRPELHEEARTRAARIERIMRRSPTLSGESYPDECWTFCNTTALAALAMFDRAFGTDHGDLARAWTAYAKAHLVDSNGILISSYTREGQVKDSAEGSSIWMSAQNLLIVDEDFARDQYGRARKELGETFLGFGYAREWPRGATMRTDVDSGPIIPLFEASAGSSGLALLGASAFGDEPYLSSLLASLELAAFPKDGRYQASNAVGDSVLFYALEFGPLWKKVRSRACTSRCAAWASARTRASSRACRKAMRRGSSARSTRCPGWRS